MVVVVVVVVCVRRLDHLRSSAGDGVPPGAEGEAALASRLTRRAGGAVAASPELTCQGAPPPILAR